MQKRTAYKSRKIKTSSKASRTRPIHHHKHNFAQSIQRLVLPAILFVLSLLILGGYSLYKNLTANFVSADSVNAYNIVNKDIVMVALFSVDDLNSTTAPIKELSVITFDVNNKKLIYMTLPTDFVIETPGKFGKEELSKMLALGSISSNDNEGVSLLKRGLSEIFGYSVDRFIKVSSSAKAEIEKSVLSGDFTFPLKLVINKDLKSEFISDLSFNEAYYIYKFIRSLPEDRILKRDLTYDYLQDSQAIDDDLRDITFDSSVANERKGVSILNGAGVPGLATMGARVVENSGARLLAVGNASKTYEQSVLITDDLSSITAKELANYFKIKTILLKGNASTYNENEIDRSGVTVIIGVDTANEL